ncbi:MAG: D-cysteine desulfhydrase family protein [Anaerolineales bacterium]|jgi:D-cysteine desulfhydrase family pyridoxal phosphate-dependent enzyme
MKEYPRFPLAHLPTPVEELESLSKSLGGPRILVKRDDQTGLAFGGNKTRKLEYLVAEAQAQNAKTLITTGAIQSNHCRQTAAAARRAGMDCILVLTGEEPDDPEANTFLDLLLDAEIVWTTKEQREKKLNDTTHEAEADGRTPYLVPYGGSNPIGAAAYAYAVRELVEQGIEADWVVFATSSGGTQAGMVAGKALFGFKGKLLGVSVDPPKDPFRQWAADLAKEVTLQLGNAKEFTKEDILVNDDYIDPGYAVMTEVEKEAIRLFARHEALLVDPVYTGRAAAGMIALIRQGFFRKDESILFWHTGGTPALFADEYRAEILK